MRTLRDEDTNLKGSGNLPEIYKSGRRLFFNQQGQLTSNKDLSNNVILEFDTSKAATIEFQGFPNFKFAHTTTIP